MAIQHSRLPKKDLMEQLVSNNVLLQQKTTDLLVEMSTLIKKVDKLVEIFTKAAEHIEKGDVKEPLAAKLTDLLDQNKKIASGLLLLERYVREKQPYGETKKEEPLSF